MVVGEEGYVWPGLSSFCPLVVKMSTPRQHNKLAELMFGKVGEERSEVKPVNLTVLLLLLKMVELIQLLL